MACLKRAMENEQNQPDDVNVHRRQANWSLFFAAFGWLITVGGSLPIIFGWGANSPATLKISGCVVLFGLIPALISVGQAAAAIRTRGDRMRRATWGMTLAGSQLGLMLGLLVINIWHS